MRGESKSTEGMQKRSASRRRPGAAKRKAAKSDDVEKTEGEEAEVLEIHTNEEDDDTQFDPAEETDSASEPQTSREDDADREKQGDLRFGENPALSSEEAVEETSKGDSDDERKQIAPVEESGAVMQGEGTADEHDESALDIDSDVVEKIVAITCRSVDGILQMKGNFISSLQEGLGGTDITKGVQVEMVGEDACTVSVSIIMEYGKSAKKIFNELHDRICEKVSDMTGLRVAGVKVRVVDVMTREEVEGRNRTNKSKSRDNGKPSDDETRDDESDAEGQLPTEDDQDGDAQVE